MCLKMPVISLTLLASCVFSFGSAHEATNENANEAERHGFYIPQNIRAIPASAHAPHAYGQHPPPQPKHTYPGPLAYPVHPVPPVHPVHASHQRKPNLPPKGTSLTKWLLMLKLFGIEIFGKKKTTTTKQTTKLTARPFPAQYTRANGCGYKFNTMLQTYSAAKKYCKDIGGQLISQGAREISIMHEIRFAILSPGVDKFWIGLDETKTIGTWKWCDGQSQTSTTGADGWATGEPDGDGDCAVLNVAGAGFFDINCAEVYPSVCEHCPS